MEFEFDPVKDTANQRKHGLPLAFGVEVIEAAHVELLDDRHDEDRFVSFGRVGGRLFACVWTPRGDRVRVISVRKANRREAARYG